MPALRQERPATSSPKRMARSRRGTTDKAYGHRGGTTELQHNPREARSLAPRKPAAEEAARPPMQHARSRFSPSVFLESFSLVKSFTLFGFMIAALHVIVLGLDLAIAWPFQRASVLFDITGVVCGLLLFWLSWGTFRDQVREGS